MDKYEIISESLQEQVNEGVLTLEDAEILNDLAYEKYVTEGKLGTELKETAKVVAKAAVISAVIIGTLVLVNKLAAKAKDPETKKKIKEMKNKLMSAKKDSKKKTESDLEASKAKVVSVLNDLASECKNPYAGISEADIKALKDKLNGSAIK